MKSEKVIEFSKASDQCRTKTFPSWMLEIEIQHRNNNTQANSDEALRSFNPVQPLEDNYHNRHNYPKWVEMIEIVH